MNKTHKPGSAASSTGTAKPAVAPINPSGVKHTSAIPRPSQKPLNKQTGK